MYCGTTDLLGGGLIDPCDFIELNLGSNPVVHRLYEL